jgi:large subunit ribosomal protein L19
MEARVKLGLRSGDTVRVWQKIKEGDKIRLQAFEGLVLSRKHGNDAGATFTVRKVVDGVGVERIFPLYSPVIDEIEITRRSEVRRSKLYFIREKASKEIRRQMSKERAAKDVEVPAEAVAEPVKA